MTFRRGCTDWFKRKSTRKQWRKSIIKLQHLSQLVNQKTVRVWYNWFIGTYGIWYDSNGKCYHVYPIANTPRDPTVVIQMLQTLDWQQVNNNHYFIVEQ
jgi:hypothetical protein